ncbi:hypothetical protein [Staphylococcus massiliensis]|nr:hypothetical protein [Staphylococcus massiliensis]
MLPASSVNVNVIGTAPFVGRAAEPMISPFSIRKLIFESVPVKDAT